MLKFIDVAFNGCDTRVCLGVRRCAQLAKTWERFPNEWIMAAFVHRRLMTWQEGAAALGISLDDLKAKDLDLKQTIQRAIAHKVVSSQHCFWL